MSRSLNRVTLIGYIGKDPEVRYMPNGAAVTKCSLATSESWRDKETDEKKTTIEWHRLVFFNKLAEIVGEYVKKGALLYVEGKIKYSEYTDSKTGITKYSTEIHVNEVKMLGSKKEEGRGEQLAEVPKQSNSEYEDEIPF